MSGDFLEVGAVGSAPLTVKTVHRRLDLKIGVGLLLQLGPGR